MKSTLRKFSPDRAFTRTDLLFAVLAACVLAGTTRTLVGGNKSGSDLAVCFNNLRQIGIGFEAAKENNSGTWWLNLSNSEGGGTTRPLITDQAWAQMALVSNYLASPKILACPADKTVHLAATWGPEPGGFLNPAFRNAALSYALSPHAQSFAGKTIFSADRNIRFISVGSSCSYANGFFSTALSGSPETRWTNALHGLMGHVLATDGTVTLTSSAALRTALEKSAPEAYTAGGPAINVHFAVPR